MTQEEFVSTINTVNGIVIDELQPLKIRITNAILKNDMIETLGKIFDYEKDLENVNVILDLKGLDTELLLEAIKYALTREDLKDPVMILNILNLVKIYNTLDDSFFENKNIYVSSIEDMLDLKLSLRNELKSFSKQLSIYFISLFKSYNKISYNPLDSHIQLPNIYSAIFLSSDILTLSGIFAVSETFSTENCVYIDDSFKYISNLLTKNVVALDFMNGFFKGLNNGITE